MLTLGKLTDFQILFLIIQTKKGKSGTVEVASLIVASWPAGHSLFAPPNFLEISDASRPLAVSSHRTDSTSFLDDIKYSDNGMHHHWTCLRGSKIQKHNCNNVLWGKIVQMMFEESFVNRQEWNAETCSETFRNEYPKFLGRSRSAF